MARKPAKAPVKAADASVDDELVAKVRQLAGRGELMAAAKAMASSKINPDTHQAIRAACPTVYSVFDRL